MKYNIKTNKKEREYKMANLKLNKDENNIEIIITESGDAWTNFLSKAKKDLISNLEVKGFRKGNVPENIAMKNITEHQIWNKAADLLIDGEYSRAIELLMKEKIATQPKLSVRAVSNESIEAVLTCIAMPEVTIGDRSAIKDIEFKVEEVTQEEIDKEVGELKTMFQDSKEAPEDAVAKNGDIANIDFSGKVNGEPFEGGESKGFDLKLGSRSFIEGFEPQVEGMKKGETKEIKVTFPEQYPSEEVAGKEAIFTVTLNSLKTLVDLEGEALKAKLETLGFESKEEIIEKIKDLIGEQKEQVANDKFFRAYIDAIIELEDTKINIPNEIVLQEIDSEFQRIELQVKQQGMEMKNYLKTLEMTAEEFKEKTLKEASLKRVKDGLIYSKLIEDLDIKVEEKDFDDEYVKISKNTKATMEEIKKQITKESIEANIIYSKLIEAIKNK